MWYFSDSFKKCPFCNSPYLDFECEVGDFHIGYIAYIKCESCNATHGWCYGDTLEEACKNATDKWNTRTKIL